MTQTLADGSPAAIMARCVALARRGWFTTKPNPRVGCAVVRDGEIVGEGWHERAGEAHAEVRALERAGARAAGSTVYVTLEPCSHHGRTGPCVAALIEAGVSRVVCAQLDPNPKERGRGLAALQSAGIATEVGLLAGAAQALNRGFESRMNRGRPRITSKVAASIDGRTALADGRSQWITGPEARADTHLFRAAAGAVVTGVGTVVVDDPRLDPRPELEGWEPPIRVILDSQLRTPPGARIFTTGGEIWVLTTATDSQRRIALEERGARVLQLGDGTRLSLPAVADWLAQLEVNDVWVEAGPTLNGALLEADLVDEWMIYVAPKVLGAGAQELWSMAVGSMDEAPQLAFADARMVGVDLRLRMTKARAA